MGIVKGLAPGAAVLILIPSEILLQPVEVLTKFTCAIVSRIVVGRLPGCVQEGPVERGG